MSELLTQQCSNLTGDDHALDNATSTKLLTQLEPQWELNTEKQTITHTYNFKNYYQTMAFVNVVAQIAHQQDHHP